MKRSFCFVKMPRKALLILLTLLLSVSGLGNPGFSASAMPSLEGESQEAVNAGKISFLPIVRTSSAGNPPGQPVMLGIYPTQYWHSGGVEQSLEIEFRTLDQWAGKRLSLAGVFHFLNQPNTVTNLLPYIWDYGYTPFVNLYANTSAENIANGGWDSNIRAWARNFKTYANNGQRFAFLAPLQEMNGDWVPYGLRPAQYKAAYRHIQDIFEAEGVPDASVAWVFAPNGYSRPQDPPFEDYYPGNAQVDVVAFSGYNYGFHPQNSYKRWQTPRQVYGPFITRMKAMAPGKPIFIAQTGTTAYASYGVSNDEKNQWLRTAFPYLADQGVRAVIYYNANQTYDWAFYSRNNFAFAGYRDGIADPAYEYVSPGDVKEAFR